MTQYEFYKYSIKKMQIPNIFNNYTKKHLFLHTGFALHTSFDIKKQFIFLFKPNTSVIVWVEEWLVYFIWHC